MKITKSIFCILTFMLAGCATTQSLDASAKQGGEFLRKANSHRQDAENFAARNDQGATITSYIKAIEYYEKASLEFQAVSDGYASKVTKLEISDMFGLKPRKMTASGVVVMDMKKSIASTKEWKNIYKERADKAQYDAIESKRILKCYEQVKNKGNCSPPKSQ